jgi:hypothetical protein
MRTIIIAIMFIVSPVALAEVSVNNLLPIVQFSQNEIYVKEKTGERWKVVTDCNIDTDTVTQFTIRSRRLREGTLIRLSHDKYCKVDTVNLFPGSKDRV